jgi:hypothetical protein
MSVSKTKIYPKIWSVSTFSLFSSKKTCTISQEKDIKIFIHCFIISLFSASRNLQTRWNQKRGIYSQPFFQRKYTILTFPSSSSSYSSLGIYTKNDNNFTWIAKTTDLIYHNEDCKFVQVQIHLFEIKKHRAVEVWRPTIQVLPNFY